VPTKLWRANLIDFIYFYLKILIYINIIFLFDYFKKVYFHSVYFKVSFYLLDIFAKFNVYMYQCGNIKSFLIIEH